MLPHFTSRMYDYPAPNELHLRVDVHDRSRVEWVATVPMAPAGEQHTYEILFEADVPDSVWVRHVPWDHFQVRTRLTSPTLTPGQKLTCPPIDLVRRRGLGAVHLLKLGTRPLLETLSQARRRDNMLRPEEAEHVLDSLRAAIERANAARQAIDELHDSNDASLERERALAGEYISTQVMLVITRVGDAMARARSPRGRVRPALGGAVSGVRAALQEALLAEQGYRRTAGIKIEAIRTARDIEPFVNRAALLKKHFQQALFLDASAYMLDQRLRNWIAAAVAMIASTFYFVWQVYVLNTAMSAQQTTVSLAMAALVAALVYAAKDRIKEVGRDWLALRLKHIFADRVAHLRLPARMDKRRRGFALARETISVTKQLQPDPLNPGVGQTTSVHHLKVRELLRHRGLELLHDQGLNGLKHVFRYDLSPHFAKLDDHLKRVPMVTMGGVRSVGATRLYRIPMRVSLQRIDVEGAPIIERRVVLLLRRRGLERVVPVDDVRNGRTLPAAMPTPKAVETTVAPDDNATDHART